MYFRQSLNNYKEPEQPLDSQSPLPDSTIYQNPKSNEADFERFRTMTYNEDIPQSQIQNIKLMRPLSFNVYNTISNSNEIKSDSESERFSYIQPLNSYPNSIGLEQMKYMQNMQ